MLVEDALNVLGLGDQGVCIGETIQSVHIHQKIETQYQKAMLQTLRGSTSNVLTKKNALRIREAYLELKTHFVEPDVSSISESEEGVLDSVPVVVDLTEEYDISRNDGEANYSNQTGLDQMIGVRVRKNMWFKGKVTCIWSHDDKSMPLWKRKNWHVEYEDGDEEDLIWQQLTKYPKDDLCDRELGDEGYEFWKQFTLEGTVTKIHHFQGRELFFQVEYDDFPTDEIFTRGELVGVI